ncbi:hypothetical protein [Acetobacterium sp. K1/6]|uniref:hypothetical protein n=1 Tax=Acetobacterium sp. K1/6 TaxID=3055467 RepID=UPI002ACA41C3|nr:hypothetical protein [Acetobacterium sp. K1/6]MDZ5724892.1 hypothetical protein [Acetobacterium sp. K1/6]
MEPLITIETVPIKLEFVEKETLALSSVQAVNASNNVSQQQVVKREPIKIAVGDSFVPSSTYNWDNPTYTATAKIGDDGKLKLNIQMEDGDSRAIRFTQANRSIDSMANKVNNNDSADSGSMQLSIPISALPGGMPTADNLKTEFLPPDLEMVVTQRAEVIIKYVGGPIYVPPSADPSYSPPIGFEQKAEPSTGIQLNQKA